MRRVERPSRQTTSRWSPYQSSLYDVMQNRRDAKRLANLFFLRMTLNPPDPWWSRTGSNRRPPACKAGALPAELRPLIVPDGMVGLGGLEPPTSRLSSARSNQLSYKPLDCVSSPKTRSRRTSRKADSAVAARAAPSRGAASHKAAVRRASASQSHSRRKRNEGGMSRTGMLGQELTGSGLVLQRTERKRSARDIPLGFFLRKEVIQPQVPLRLPCYDFTPVADPTVVACLPCGLAQRLRVKPTPMV